MVSLRRALWAEGLGAAVAVAGGLPLTLTARAKGRSDPGAQNLMETGVLGPSLRTCLVKRKGQTPQPAVQSSLGRLFPERSGALDGSWEDSAGLHRAPTFCPAQTSTPPETRTPVGQV